MARARSTVATRRQTFVSGLFHGVKNTNTPFDSTPDFLQDAGNGYVADPVNGSEFVARPGFQVVNPSSPLATPGQAIYTHVGIDGTEYNFVVSGGKLYRVDANLSTITDVTPAGSPISSTAKRVYLTSFIGQLVISDGVNKPWVATNLSSTPVTRTAIDFDGAGTAWSAYGQPVVWTGSLFFILNTVNSVGARLDIAWSVPGDPLTGYQQTNYDFRWTIEQTSELGPIHALAPTNSPLYYFRDGSIGAITGVPGPDLQTTATHDAVAVDIGCLQSATITQYGNYLYFCDVNGRRYRMAIGNAPEPIWLNMRSVVDDSTSAYPAATAQVACSTIIPSLNLDLSAIWSPVPGIAQAPMEIQVFDTKTGLYQGRWNFVGGASIEAMGVLNNTAGRGSFAFLGSKVSGSAPATGYLWVQNTTAGGGIPLTAEDDGFLLTESGLQLTAEGNNPSWVDNTSDIPDIYATTDRLGFSLETAWNYDTATVLTGVDTPCRISVRTSAVPITLEGTPTPSASNDGTYRLTGGLDAVQGRGAIVKVSPMTADTQWVLYQTTITGTPSRLTPDEA